MLRGVSFLLCLVAAFCYEVENVHEMEIGKPVYQSHPLGKFVYTACNTTNVPIYVKELDISPEPFKFGSTVKLNAVVDLSETIPNTENIFYDMDILMFAGGSYNSVCGLIPAQNVCHGKDVCGQLKNLIKTCPPDVVQEGSNCRCPFKKNTYSFKGIDFLIPTLGFQIDGRFRIVLKLRQDNTQLMCAQMDFCIESC